MNKNMKRSLSLVVAGALMLGVVTPNVDAAAKLKLSKKKVTVEVGKKTVLKVKNTKKKAKWSIKSGKKVISLAKKKKTSVTIVGKKAGKAVVQAKIGKKKLSCKVTVKATTTNAVATPTASAVSTTTPVATTTPVTTPTATPATTPSVTTEPTSTPVVTAVPTTTPIVTVAPTMTPEPTETPEPTPIPDPFVYDGLNTEWIDANIDPSKPVVAFTFDDGPGQNGPAIQELLKEAGAHATFFYIGQNMESDSGRDEVLAAIENGFEVGNHSYGYGTLDTRNEEALEEFVGETNAILTDITGYSSFLFRAPELAISSTMLNYIQAPFINCAVDSKDWDGATAEEVAANVTAAKDGDIVLMHVNQKATLEALPDILAYYKENGIQIVSVSELYAIRNANLYPGHTYTSCKATSN